MYTQRKSVEVPQVTGSLLLRIIFCCLIVLYYRWYLDLEGNPSCCEELLSGSLHRLVHSVKSRLCTVTVSITSAAMATGNDGDGRPKSDRSGVRFSNLLQTSWNAPDSFVTLSSAEVVALDTSVVPDMLGLRTCYPNAEPSRVLPRRAPNSVRALIPDDRAKRRGFHDVTLVDDQRDRSASLKRENLRRQWPTSLLTGMTRRQTDLEALRRECKAKFRSSQAGSLYTMWAQHYA